MFTSGIQDLAKPQWLAAIKALKTHGSMPISQLAEQLGVSYMAAKKYGEDLARLGYLERIRTPRTAVGRPEIFYRAAAQVDDLLPAVGAGFCLEILDHSRVLFGENAPERLIYQHFETLRERWGADLENIHDPVNRAKKLAALRTASGAVCVFKSPNEHCPRLIEHHNPLTPLFKKYPRAAAIDLRLIDELVGTRVERAQPTKGSATVEFLFPDLATPEPN